MAPSQRGYAMIGIITALIGLSTIAVILRIIARMRRRIHLGTDDYLAIASLVLLYGMYIELILCTIRALFPFFPFWINS